MFKLLHNCTHLSSVQFSRSVVSNSLRPRGLQHARPPCPSPTPRVYSNSCPLSQRCHPAISSPVVPFSSRPQSFQASGSFPVSQFFTSGGQRIGVSASASALPMNTQDWSPLGWTGWISLQSKGLSRVFSNTTFEKHRLSYTVTNLYFICVYIYTHVYVCTYSHRYFPLMAIWLSCNYLLTVHSPPHWFRTFSLACTQFCSVCVSTYVCCPVCCSLYTHVPTPSGSHKCSFVRHLNVLRGWPFLINLRRSLSSCREILLALTLRSPSIYKLI